MDWESLAAASSIGLLWRPAPPLVHLHCQYGGELAEQNVAPAGRAGLEIDRVFAIPLACRRAFRKFWCIYRVFSIPLACRRAFPVFLLIDRVLAIPLARRRAFRDF